ncbi:MAG TPA: PAS domain-containing protein, partial [Prosthecobacter sp.]|nr:PAS domain-containing protein [Prosthecobacter sp.]
VRSEHDALAGPDGQRIVYRWEVRPWRRRRDASVGGLMVTCEKFSTTVPLQTPTAEAEAAKVAEQNGRRDLSACAVPMVLVDEQGVVHQANDAAVDLCLARGIQEGVSTFWDVFADGRDVNILRQQTMAAIEKLASTGATKAQSIEAPRENGGNGAGALPEKWLLSTAKTEGPARRFVAFGLPSTQASRPFAAPGIANLPALAHAVAAIAQPSAAEGVTAALEVRRLQDDLSRARQELRTLHEAERTFTHRENRIRQYLEVLPCGVLVLDELGVPVFQNEQLARLLGRPIQKDETVEQWLAAGCPNEEHCREVAAIWRDDVWRRQLTRTFSLATADGLLKELEFRPVPLPRAGLLITIQDATESCRHEEQLRATEAKFRTLLHEAPIPIVLMDKVGAVFEVNHLAEELLGHPKAELRRYPLDAWLEPESGSARREAARQMASATRRSSSLEVRIRQPNGQPSVDAEVHMAQVLDADGEPHSMVHFFQKQAPQPPAATPPAPPLAVMTVARTQPQSEAGAVTVLKTNVNGRIKEWSARAEELFGLKAEHAQGQPLHQYFRPSDATGFYAELARLAQEPEEVRELSFYDAQKERQTCRLQVRPREDGGSAFELAEFVESPAPQEEQQVSGAAQGTPQVLAPILEDGQRWPLADLSREKLLLSETHHRIKNHLQIISSLLNLESNILSEGAARNALLSSQNR